MLNLAQLLARETPPEPVAGRAVRLMPADKPEAGEAQHVCIACGKVGGDDDYYWRRRKNGALHRLKRCRACHIVQSEAAARIRKAKSRKVTP